MSQFSAAVFAKCLCQFRYWSRDLSFTVNIIQVQVEIPEISKLEKWFLILSRKIVKSLFYHNFDLAQNCAKNLELDRILAFNNAALFKETNFKSFFELYG